MAEQPYIMPVDGFPVVLTDPPWEYRVWSAKGAGRTASAHYDVAAVDKIAAIPLPDILAKNAIVFMWATWPNLLEAIALGGRLGA